MTRGAAVRRGRLAALLGAGLVTATAVVGALSGAGNPPPATADGIEGPAASLTGAVGERQDTGSPESPASTTEDEGPTVLTQSPENVDADRVPPLPARSGDGRRVVFDMSEQRVWLVRESGRVARTYPVSGSVYDNLDPGTYEVYSRSEQAYAFDGSGSMKWMVRFTQGDNAAIGFHDIPIDEGELAQTRAQLGTPQSHGCIRQWPDDAKALWRFAPLGTTVVVTA